MRRVRKTLVAVGIPSLLAASNPLYLNFSRPVSTGAHIALAAIVAALAGLYVYGYRKLTQRIRAVSSPV